MPKASKPSEAILRDKPHTLTAAIFIHVILLDKLIHKPNSVGAKLICSVSALKKLLALVALFRETRQRSALTQQHAAPFRIEYADVLTAAHLRYHGKLPAQKIDLIRFIGLFRLNILAKNCPTNNIDLLPAL